MSKIGEKFDFFGISDDKLIYDERKKRFVYTKDLPANLAREYRTNSFKEVSAYQPLLTSLLSVATP